MSEVQPEREELIQEIEIARTKIPYIIALGELAAESCSAITAQDLELTPEEERAIRILSATFGD